MKTKIFLLFLIILASSSFGFGQKIKWFMSPMGSLNDVKKGAFSSTEAGFAIDLPREIGGFSGTKGIQYNWRLNEGYYYVGVEDKETEVENSGKFEGETLAVVDYIFREIASNLFETPPKVVSLDKKEFAYQEHKGLDARIVLSDTICLIRVFWIKNRAYKMAVLLTEKQKPFEAAAQKVFDSLKVFPKENNDAMIQKKIEENTPKPLPQTPVAKKLKSDAQDEALQGKVKTISQQSQFIKGENAGSPKQKDYERFYNEAGNLVKSINYDDTNGFPSQITVYGYINGSRVSNSGYIEYESQPPGILVAEAPAVTRRRDRRYDYRYVYKYDASGNLVERINYDNAGIIWTRTVFKRKGNSIEAIVYADGKINNRSLTKLDDKGLEIEETNYDSPLEGWNSIYTYKYEEFDKAGNWTKRTMTKSRASQGITSEEWVMVVYRTITYY